MSIRADSIPHLPTKLKRSQMTGARKAIVTGAGLVAYGQNIIITLATDDPLRSVEIEGDARNLRAMLLGLVAQMGKAGE